MGDSNADVRFRIYSLILNILSIHVISPSEVSPSTVFRFSPQMLRNILFSESVR